MTIADDRSYLRFPIAQGTLLWQPVFVEKLRKLPYPPSFIALAFQTGSGASGGHTGRAVHGSPPDLGSQQPYAGDTQSRILYKNLA